MDDNKIPKVTFKEFLESTPPGKTLIVGDFAKKTGVDAVIIIPKIRIYCDKDECQDYMFFNMVNSSHGRISITSSNDVFIQYSCRNCTSSYKTYALNAMLIGTGSDWLVQKYGELPKFGPPIPSRVYNLIGGDRELFLSGRRSENIGLGIGAFTYYQRVIENQKNKILNELIRVIEVISPNDAVLKDLKSAKNEVQFAKAIESIKHAIPQSLFINGYNPLTLLHSALSEGVHDLSDNECLDMASSVRQVLFEFSERLGQALKDDKELNDAVTKLANRSKNNKK